MVIQWCAEDSSYCFAKVDCTRFFPILSSVVSCWLLEISHGRNIYTIEIGSCYKSAYESIPLLESKSIWFRQMGAGGPKDEDSTANTTGLFLPPEGPANTPQEAASHLLKIPSSQ